MRFQSNDRGCAVAFTEKSGDLAQAAPKRSRLIVQ